VLSIGLNAAMSLVMLTVAKYTLQVKNAQAAINNQSKRKNEENNL
jgi:hypothetical protein